MFRSKWQIPATESRYLGSISIGAFRTGASLTILDAATCGEIESISLMFDSVADPLIIVPATGAATSRAMTVAEQQALRPAASPSPEVCLGPSDGWSLSVVNRSDRAFSLAMLAPDAGGVGPPGRAVFDVSPHADGTVTWPSVVGETAAGPIDLLDPTTCSVLDTVDHPAWGTFVVTIAEPGDLTIEPGLLPLDGVPLPGRMQVTGRTGCERAGSGEPSAR